MRGWVVDVLAGESGRSGEDANARRRCEGVKMGCGCDGVWPLSWSVSITDTLLILGLYGAGCKWEKMDGRNCMQGVEWCR